MDQRNPLFKTNLYDRRPIGQSALFFNPDGEMMYVERNAILFGWKLQEREGPEWWIGEFGYDT